MERDNKKAREDARREYNETVRVRKQYVYIPLSLTGLQSLVKFIRKRDPRYKRHLETQANTPTSRTPARVDKQKASDVYVEQEWQKVDTSRLHVDLDWAVAEGDDLEEWECVVCRKTFRSEAAWNSHERSKKHLKELESLKRDMEQDAVELDLDHATEDAETETTATEGEQSTENIVVSPKSELNEAVDLSNLKMPPTDQGPPDSKATSHEEPTGMNDRADTALHQPSKREKRRARHAKRAELQDIGVRELVSKS